MPERRSLVARVLAKHPICEICREKPSGTLHEPLLRSRGGSPIDPGNVLAVCVGPDSCHDRLHAAPASSLATGLMRSSWDEPGSKEAALRAMRGEP